MKEFFANFIQSEDAQGMVEYALILALIALAVIGALGFLGTGLSSFFDDVTNELSSLIQQQALNTSYLKKKTRIHFNSDFFTRFELLVGKFLTEEKSEFSQTLKVSGSENGKAVEAAKRMAKLQAGAVEAGS